MSVFAYIRHTSPSGPQPDAEEQRRGIRARAEQLGLSVTAWLEDEWGTSNVPLSERPAGDWLYRQLQPGDQVLVFSGSLLSVSLLDWVQVFTDWHGRGVVLHFRGCGAWHATSETVEGVNFVDVMGKIFEFERLRRSEIIQDGIRERQREGKRHGANPPLGMKWEKRSDGEYWRVVDSEEIAVMRQIVAWRDEGWTWHKIYFEMIARGIRTREGKEWGVTRIRKADKRIREAMELAGESA